MLKDLIAFVFSKSFIKNLGLYILIISLLIFSVFFGLRFYTNHGDTINVPDLIDFSVNEAFNLVDDSNLRMEIQDSVYMKNHMPGRIISQNPAAFAILNNGDSILRQVKENRKIYVTISRFTPPTKRMPELVDISERVALIKLETAGLAVGKITYQPNSLGDNLILKQSYKGKSIKAGAPIKMGEKIDLVVSKKTYASTSAPDVYGLSIADAKRLLNEHSLNLGIVLKCINCKDKVDSSLARIYDQKPRYGDGELGIGANVDIYLTTDTVGFRK